MASYSDSGSNPLRRQCTLKELPLIAATGQRAEAIRQTMLVALEPAVSRTDHGRCFAHCPGFSYVLSGRLASVVPLGLGGHDG